MRSALSPRVEVAQAGRAARRHEGRMRSFLPFAILLAGCAAQPEPAPDMPAQNPVKARLAAEPFEDLSARAKPEPVVREGWREVVIGAPDIAEIARLWTEVGGFEVRERGEGMMVLGAPGVEDWGLIRLVEASGPATRPYGSQAWDTGCYFSVMHRAKGMESIVADARGLGWETLTEDVVYLEFGPSKLHVVVLAHPPTGVQVQLYERLTTPLPEGFPAFERISAPFNIMQMVRDRDAAYDFFQQGLGFSTFYYGRPFVSEREEVVPINIPVELSDEVAYRAAIVSPEPGMEWGRMEMIAIDDDPRLEGEDLSGRCDNPVGIREVVFATNGQLEAFEDMIDPVRRSDIESAAAFYGDPQLDPDSLVFRMPISTELELVLREGAMGFPRAVTVRVQTPDGARIIFDTSDATP